ncbi:hypothetical protein IQ250_20685 [Pseudanabaenaceae cyanobacterium LEGE 13415]|nr:hypothetical protein [Pseudanabaenaceae cyanobacterium LEGE 13415]
MQTCRSSSLEADSRSSVSSSWNFNLSQSTANFDESLIRYLAEEGYQPEFGARELRRQIRQKVETKLASEMLKGAIR